MTVIEQFAAFSTSVQPPPEAVHAAKRCLLDWFGAGIAGSTAAPATMLRHAFPGSGTSRLLADGVTRDARTAALINGTASHIVEVDDIYRSGLYHPGVVTIPAALALAEAQSASGTDLLNAIIAGYEVSNRIARAVNPAHYQHWHTTGTVGHFGATVAAARLLNLDAARTAHAMATVATFAAGLRHAFSSDAMSKPLHAGRAAEGGVAAALMARADVTGVLDMLEGVRGFGVSMSADVDWQSAVSTLGSEWTIIDTTPKAHACCGHNFAALDAIGILMQEHGIQAEEIAGIEIATYRAAVEICGNANPQTAPEGRFSLPYCASVMAHVGHVTPQAFMDTDMLRKDYRDLASRITLAVDPGAEAKFPHARSATVSLCLKDGQTLTHHRPTRKGDPDDPLSDADLRAKYRQLAEPVLGGTRAEALANAVMSIDTIINVRELPIGQVQLT